MDQTEETIGHEGLPEDNDEEAAVHPMDVFLEEDALDLKAPRRGEIRKGTVARVSDGDILVDIGYKSEGVVTARELEKLPPEKRAELQVGVEVDVYVVSSRDPIKLSIVRAEEEQDWLRAEALMESKEPFEGVISGFNKGGLIVKLGRLRGFIPASQVSMSRRWRAEGDTPEKRWGKMVGEPIVVRVIEVDRRRNRLILSERAAARESRELLKERLIGELEVGEVRTGHVISLAEFGAFVDIGGADGLVHTSEITWKRINHPKDVLKVGQEVQVKVLGVDPERNRISLSMRELEADPWETLVEQFQEGQLVEGTITKLTKFGAFASIKGLDEYELEGLIHISELADRHVVHPKEVVSEGETLTLRIIRIDRERRRIGLSLRKVDSPEYRELDLQVAMRELESARMAEAEAPAEGSEGAAAQGAAPADLVAEEPEAREASAEEAAPEPAPDETVGEPPARAPEEAAPEQPVAEEGDAAQAEAMDEPEVEQAEALPDGPPPPAEPSAEQSPEASPGLSGDGEAEMQADPLSEEGEEEEEV